MDKSLTVNCQFFTAGQHFFPGFIISLERPVVFIESSPKNGSAVFVNILLNCKTIIKVTKIHYANCIVFFAVDFYDVSSCDIADFRCGFCRNTVIFPVDKTFGFYKNFVSDIVFAKCPVFHKYVVKEGKLLFNIFVIMSCGKVATMRVC